MNDTILPIDEPRLTAYALGELTDPTDLAEIDALLRDSAAARAEVEEIRAFAKLLVAEYDADRALPDNVIALPPPRRSFSGVWLSLAAAVAVLGVIVSLSLPVYNSVQVKGSLVKQRAAEVQQSQTAGAPEPAITPSAANVPASPLLAQTAAPTPDPKVRLEKKADLDGMLDATASATAPAEGALRPLGSPRVSISSDHRPEVSAAGELASAGAVLDRRKVEAGLPLFAAAKAAVPRNREMDARSAGLAEVGKDKVAAGRAAVSRSLIADAATASGSVAQSPAFQPAAEQPPAPLSRPATTAPVLGDVPVIGRLYPHRGDTARYEHREENAFLAAKENPLSTFSVDVDTASYANVRRFIENGSLPPTDAVRVEEMLNYFPYSDAPPAADNPRPFAIHLEVAACPWAPEHRLVRIGIKGREMAVDQRPASNLVFLVDVSGSMSPPNRLPLIKESLRLMTEKLGAEDRVGIVVYAGESGVALPSTAGEHKDQILTALGALHSGGSTNGAAGITLAYQIAQEHFIKGGVNRVILATDGDFNVGVTDQAELIRLIEKQAKSGVFLSVLGVGTGNLQDATMQKLADRGNGNYAYLDSIAEGRKVLVEQMSGTLVTIAKDVKIQVEFNPAAVAAYRLIGYEKRALRNEDFNNDKVDAGEIGAGHSVVALYEIAPVGQPVPGSMPGVDALKYGADAKPAPAPTPAAGDAPKELLTVKMRHKAPDGDRSERSYEVPLVDRGAPGEYANASADFKFSAAVASFGLVLRGSAYQGSATLGSAIELAEEGKGPDASGYRAGFIELAGKAQALRHSGEMR